MIVDDRLANRLADFLVIECPQVFALHLLDDDHTFFVVDLDAERRAGAGDEAGMTVARRLLDIAGIVIPAAHDDQVLETPGDVQVAVLTGIRDRRSAGIRAGLRRCGVCASVA